jgi:hypothetical protein
MSEKIDTYLPPLRWTPYILYSPPESLETLEMQQIMAARKAVPSDNGAAFVMIHRFYQPILNFIPVLTDFKREKTEFYLFGSYLDFEIVDDKAQSIFASEPTKIFPNGGRICFTMDHLLENPLHILKIVEMMVVIQLHMYLTLSGFMDILESGLAREHDGQA